ncbi:hypothetical protein Cgig2_011114 [Carnegiea gigantea]|uniref:Uncharacterized protein n=1 Tax=Carnegiea gigantea TaxID=171969 RepID=A0A9Q1JU50_9CARY|nr:hypothetical protein Cgig2_011114 [Carnegiea gigantea]
MEKEINISLGKENHPSGINPGLGTVLLDDSSPQVGVDMEGEVSARKIDVVDAIMHEVESLSGEGLYELILSPYFETHISGSRADEVCNRLSFGGKLYVEAQGFQGRNRKLWLLARNFNETWSLGETNHGGQNTTRRCLRFNNWIENNGLVDLGFYERRFTWVRGNTEDTRKCTKLDRALCNVDWRSRFQDEVVQQLIRDQSEDSPLLISTKGLAPS